MLSGATEGSQLASEGSQAADNKGIFGDILLAESTPPAGQTDKSGSGLQGGNGLPHGGNALPVSPVAPTALLANSAELDLTAELASTGDLVEPDLFPLASGDVVPTQAASDLAVAPSLTTAGLSQDLSVPVEVEQQLLAGSAQLTDALPAIGPALDDGAELPAPSTISPEAEAVPLVPPQSLAATTVTGSAALPPAAGGVASVVSTELEGSNSLTNRDPLAIAVQDSRGQAGSGVSLAAEGAGVASRNGSDGATFSSVNQKPVTLADDVILESADTFQALDIGRAKTVLSLSQSQPLQGAPLAGLSAPTVLEATSSATKLPPLQPLSVPPGEPQWSGELAGRVAVMLKNGNQEASLQLNPPELGRLDIRIATEGDQARVQFAVHNADARDVLEQNMPRLRELLEQGGMTLARGDVADHSQSRRESDASMSGKFGALADEDIEPAAVAFAVPGEAILDGRVDYYV